MTWVGLSWGLRKLLEFTWRTVARKTSDSLSFPEDGLFPIRKFLILNENGERKSCRESRLPHIHLLFQVNGAPDIRGQCQFGISKLVL